MARHLSAAHSVSWLTYHHISAHSLVLSPIPPPSCGLYHTPSPIKRFVSYWFPLVIYLLPSMFFATIPFPSYFIRILLYIFSYSVSYYFPLNLYFLFFPFFLLHNSPYFSHDGREHLWILSQWILLAAHGKPLKRGKRVIRICSLHFSWVFFSFYWPEKN